MIVQIKSFDYIMRDDHSYQFYNNIDDQITSYKTSPILFRRCVLISFIAKASHWLRLRLEG
jgi:hypothetical protein